MLYTPPRLSPFPRILLWLGLAITVVVFISGLGGAQEQRRCAERVQAIRVAQDRARPLIAAIQHYAREKGHPPVHPTSFLSLPDPGPLPGKSDWHYQVLTRNRWQLELNVDPALAMDRRLDDCLIYRSDEQYDTRDDEYAVERFGDWAYCFRR